MAVVISVILAGAGVGAFLGALTLWRIDTEWEPGKPWYKQVSIALGGAIMGALGFWPVMLRWLWEKVRCLTKILTKRSP